MHSQQQGKLYLYVRGTLDRCSELVSYASVEEDGTRGLVTEVFDDSDRVGADVLLLHGCPQSCMPNAVEVFLKSVKTW